MLISNQKLKSINPECSSYLSKKAAAAAAAAANCIVPGELEDIEQTAVQVPKEVRCSMVRLGCGLEEVGLRCTAV